MAWQNNATSERIPESSGAAQEQTRSELFKGLPPPLCPLLPGELKSIEWDSGTRISSLWCCI